MIYLVTGQQELFEHDAYKLLPVEKALQMMSTWKIIQVDSETSGRDCHINDFLCVQFGNDAADAQIVVDTNTINVKFFKNILESTMLVLQNAKFDLQFFYNYGIIPRKIYDTMIVEQLLHLGYPYVSISPSAYQKNGYTFPYLEEITKEGELHYSLSFSLKAIAQKRLGIDIDKTVRGEIIWRGLDTEVIKYAAGDVMYLEKIMWSQIEDCKKQGLMKAAKIECDFVPCISYLEWCGVHLDQDKWRKKMIADKEALEKSEQALNAFVIKLSEEGCMIKSQGPKQLSQGLTVVEPDKKIPKEVFKKYVYINNQGDLFTGFDLNPHCNINWSSSKQVVKLAQELGFDTTVQDKKTGEDKDSVMEKHLKSQKGINDEFLKLYFDYQGYDKVVTSFGQGHLNAINPKTDRIHTTYKQLGCASGRMSCGSEQNNSDLAKFKGLPPNPSAKQKKEGLGCSYPNMQQLPADEITRSCFTAPKGYKWSSCDYSALESRLGADIYNEKSMLDEFLHGSGDMHSLCAYMVYKDIIPRDTPIKDIKKLYPHQRKDVKPIEFSQQLKVFINN